MVLIRSKISLNVDLHLARPIVGFINPKPAFCNRYNQKGLVEIAFILKLGEDISYGITWTGLFTFT